MDEAFLLCAQLILALFASLHCSISAKKALIIFLREKWAAVMAALQTIMGSLHVALQLLFQNEMLYVPN